MLLHDQHVLFGASSRSTLVFSLATIRLCFSICRLQDASPRLTMAFNVAKIPSRTRPATGEISADQATYLRMDHHVASDRAIGPPCCWNPFLVHALQSRACKCASNSSQSAFHTLKLLPGVPCLSANRAQPACCFRLVRWSPNVF